MKPLKNLSHPNIVVSIYTTLLILHVLFFLLVMMYDLSGWFEQRYIGTMREEDSLNILLEFVPGGSIQSLLGRLGAFPEAVSINCLALSVSSMS